MKPTHEILAGISVKDHVKHVYPLEVGVYSTLMLKSQSETSEVFSLMTSFAAMIQELFKDQGIYITRENFDELLTSDYEALSLCLSHYNEIFDQISKLGLLGERYEVDLGFETLFGLNLLASKAIKIAIIENSFTDEAHIRYEKVLSDTKNINLVGNASKGGRERHRSHDKWKSDIVNIMDELLDSYSSAMQLANDKKFQELCSNIATELLGSFPQDEVGRFGRIYRHITESKIAEHRSKGIVSDTFYSLVAKDWKSFMEK